MSRYSRFAEPRREPQNDSAPAQTAALVLAGDRRPDDAVARAAGTSCKALAPVGGRPMVLRVLDALDASGAVATTVLCGPPHDALTQCPELVDRLGGATLIWVANRDSPSASAEAGLARLPQTSPVLLTTADHALLSAEIVATFVAEARAGAWDAVVGLVPHAVVAAAYPRTRRTVTELRDGAYCSTNLFAFPTAAGRRLIPYWRRVEHSRKRPWRLFAATLGGMALLQYACGWLTLERALARLSRRLGLRVGAVILPQAAAGVDVDTPADLRLVETALAAERAGG